MDRNDRRGISRRSFLGAVGGLSLALGLLGERWFTSLQAESASQSKIRTLQSLISQREKELDDLSSKLVVYGGGSNLKYMPDTVTKQPTVPLEEIWAFDKNFAFCRVDNNPKAFIMPTYSRGDAIVDANSFYMLMVSNSMQIDRITNTPTGGARVTLRGILDCTTEAGVAGVKIGSRTTTEPAAFEIEAVDEKGRDRFAFTTLFDQDQAPLNHTIFGPKFTFTGDLKTGDVVIKRVADL